MSGGVAAGLEEVLDQVDGQALVAQVVQDDLFHGLGPDEIGDVSSPSPLSKAFSPKARGRPPGSRNKRTEAVREWLLGQHRHPLSVMMEAYSMAPADLAAAIGLRKATRTVKATEFTPEKEVDLDHYSNDVLLEVLRLQMRMAEASLPYLAQKLPQAVQLDANGQLQITFAGVSLPARGAGAAGDDAVPINGLGVDLPFKSDG